MDYKQMWYELKKRLIEETEKNEKGSWRSTAAQQQLNMMARVEVGALVDEYIHCDDEELGEREPKEAQSHIGPGSCPDDTNTENQEKEKTGKDILKDIFGDDFVRDIATLKMKLKGSKEKVIIIDADLDVPEELEREAKDRKIILARAQCGTFKMSKDGPFPMPFPFPLGFLK